MRAALLLLFAASSALAAAPAPLSVEGSVQPPTVLLGEPFTLTLKVRHARDERWELSRPADLGAFDVVEEGRERTDGSSESTTVFTVKLQAFELGELSLPAFELHADKGGERGVSRPDPLSVEVKGTLPPDAEDQGADFYDIKPPVDVPVTTLRLVYLLFALLLAMAAGLLLYRYLKRPRPAAPVVAAPVASLHDRTFAALDALRAEDLPTQGKVREFYFRLSEILRGYLGERFKIDALECTSSELVDEVRALRSRLIPFDDFVRFVDDSDLAKFAKAPIDAGQCQRSLEFGYRLVELTHAPEVSPAAAKPAAATASPKPPPESPPRAG